MYVSPLSVNPYRSYKHPKNALPKTQVLLFSHGKFGVSKMMFWSTSTSEKKKP